MSFSKQLQDWTNATQDRIEAVHRTSVDMLAQEMVRTKANGGNLPVDTGNLARGLLASQTAMPKTSDQPSVGMDVGAFTVTMDVSKATWLGFQPRYSRVANYGFVGADKLGRVHNREGNHFIERAVAMWPQIVAAAVADVKSNSKT
jgi:hypothetical protein